MQFDNPKVKSWTFSCTKPDVLCQKTDNMTTTSVVSSYLTHAAPHALPSFPIHCLYGTEDSQQTTQTQQVTTDTRFWESWCFFFYSFILLTVKHISASCIHSHPCTVVFSSDSTGTSFLFHSFSGFQCITKQSFVHSAVCTTALKHDNLSETPAGRCIFLTACSAALQGAAQSSQ